MTTFTSRFRFGIPGFLDEPWHEAFEALIHQIDNALYQIVVAEDVSFWDNSVAYDISDLVIDELTGVMYTCGVSHTSPAAPTTFAQDRVANPSRWIPTANLPAQKGNWVTGTTYNVGDFVVESQRYAVCLVGHVAGTFNTDLAAGKWVILIDLSTLGVGINTEAEDTVASGATVDLGAITSSRIFITGNTNITSFGIVANQIKILRYEQALTITHHATDLILPAATDRLTDAGGYQIVTSNSAGKWREVTWHSGVAPAALPVASTTLAGIVELATAAETQALTDNTRAVTPLGLASALSDLSASVLNTIRNGVSSTLDTLSEIASAINLLAPLASPTFTGNPLGVTRTTGDNDTSLATTEFVQQEITARRDDLLHLRDQQAANTAGGTFTSGAWRTRITNTVVTNDITGASHNTGTGVTSLPAGTYEVHGYAMGHGVLDHKTKLVNTSDATDLVIGASARTRVTDAAGGDSSSASNIMGQFTLAATKNIELQHRCEQTKATSGFGEPTNFGVIEVYVDLFIKRVKQ